LRIAAAAYLERIARNKINSRCLSRAYAPCERNSESATRVNSSASTAFLLFRAQYCAWRLRRCCMLVYSRNRFAVANKWTNTHTINCGCCATENPHSSRFIFYRARIWPFVSKSKSAHANKQLYSSAFSIFLVPSAIGAIKLYTVWFVFIDDCNVFLILDFFATLLLYFVKLKKHNQQ